MLPPFNERGNLPSGIYEINWNEFCDRFGFNSHRKKILVGLETALKTPNLLCRMKYHAIHDM